MKQLMKKVKSLLLKINLLNMKLFILAFALAALEVIASVPSESNDSNLSSESYGLFDFHELTSLVPGVFILIDEVDIGKKISIPKTYSDSELRNVLKTVLKNLNYKASKTKDGREIYIKSPVVEEFISRVYHASYYLPEALPISSENFVYLRNSDSAVLSGPKSAVLRAMSLLKLSDVQLSSRDVKYKIHVFSTNEQLRSGLDKLSLNVKGVSVADKFLSFIGTGGSISSGLLTFDSFLENLQEFEGVFRLDTVSKVNLFSTDNKFVSQSAVSNGVVSSFDSVRSHGIELTASVPPTDKSLSVIDVNIKISRPMSDSSFSATQQSFTVPLRRDYCQHINLVAVSKRSVGMSDLKNNSIMCIRFE